MVESEPFMYHSLISMYINIGFLKPIDCIRLCEETFLNKGALIAFPHMKALLGRF